MFWISYSVTFVLASAIAAAVMALRLVFSAVERAFGLISPLRQGKSASGWGVMSQRNRRLSPLIDKAD